MALEFEFLPQITAFLFVFALIYALLIYSRLFAGTKNAAAIIALVIAFFSIMYSPLVIFLQDIIPIAALLLVFLFFIVLIKRLVVEGEAKKDAVPIVAILTVFLIIVGMMWDRIGFTIPGLTSDNMLWIVGIIIVVLILAVAYSHTPKQQ